MCPYICELKIHLLLIYNCFDHEDQLVIFLAAIVLSVSVCVCMPYPKKTSVFDQRCVQRANVFYFFQKFGLYLSQHFLHGVRSGLGSLSPPVPQEQQIYSTCRKNWFSIELLWCCR